MNKMDKLQSINKMIDLVGHKEFRYTGYPRNFEIEYAINQKVLFYLSCGIDLKTLKNNYELKEKNA